MMTTAAPPSHCLTELNCRYLHLLTEIERAKAHFRYPAEEIAEARKVRNEIVELQNSLRQIDRREVTTHV